MNTTVKENIRKFNLAKEELAKYGIKIGGWDEKTNKTCLVNNGEFVGYLDTKTSSLDLNYKICEETKLLLSHQFDVANGKVVSYYGNNN